VSEVLTDDLWKQLRRFTGARIGLGRAGSSLPTAAMLNFSFAHAQARDAVHTRFDADELARTLKDGGFAQPLLVRSQARDRTEYLLRPDMGRRLEEQSRKAVEALPSGCDLVFVICDGLSSIAPVRNAALLLRAVLPQLDGWTIAPVVIASQGRVALGDEVGATLRAEMVVVLIGERPGLTSPDSMGVYLTWGPGAGRSDAERNCISNVRPEGLPYDEAAYRLAWLLRESKRRRLSGVALKDGSPEMVRRIEGGPSAERKD
jgi:ethanolamine ammonia-lyase small subunit